MFVCSHARLPVPQSCTEYTECTRTYHTHTRSQNADTPCSHSTRLQYCSTFCTQAPAILSTSCTQAPAILPMSATPRNAPTRNMFRPRGFESPVAPAAPASARQDPVAPAPVSSAELETFLRKQADIQENAARALSAKLEQGRLMASQGDDSELKKTLQDMGASPEKVNMILQYYPLWDFSAEAMAKFLRALEDFCPATKQGVQGTFFW